MANYCTWNPSDKHADVTLSNGNLTCAANIAGQWRCVRGTQAKNSGKWYFEYTYDDVSYVQGGIALSDAPLNSYCVTHAAGYDRGTLYKDNVVFTGNPSGTSPVAGSIVMIAIDLDAGKVWWGYNGTWLSGGDPEAGTGAVTFTPGTTIFPFACLQTGQITANFGASAFAYSVPSGFNSGWYEEPQTYEEEIAAEAGITAEMEALRLVDDLTAEAGVQAAFELFMTSGELPAEAGIEAEFDGLRMREDIGAAVGINAAFTISGDFTQPMMAAAGIKAEMTALHLLDDLSVAAGVNMALDRMIEVFRNMAAACGVAADFDGFNWSDFLRVYRDRISIRYKLTLSDGLLDPIDISISSFQGRFRTGNPTFLSVVVPGNDQYVEITDRDNGELILTMQYVINGTVYHSEEICRVDLEEVRLDQGSSSVSVTLSGHRTVTHIPKITRLAGASYKAVYSGKIHCRCTPDLYLRPGDTCIVGDDTFTAGMITWVVTPSGMIMEIAEEGGEGGGLA